MSLYPAPSGRGNPIYNPIDYHTVGTAGQQSAVSGITQEEADKRYLFLGNSQGNEVFDYPTSFITPASFTGNGTTNAIPLNISFLGSKVNFSVDNAAHSLIIQGTSFGAGVVVEDTVNNFRITPKNYGLALTDYNTGLPTGFNCGAIIATDLTISGKLFAYLGSTQTFTGNNTFQGTNASQVGSAPLTITNIDTGLSSAIYQDHNNQDQLTIQSNTTLGGLTLRNGTGNSFTVYPAGANNAATFINPINVINNLGVTCGSLTLSNAGNSTALTTTATGLNVADPIVSSGAITGNNLVVAPIGQHTYSIDSNSAGGYGLVITNTTGEVPTLTISNGSTLTTSLSSTASGLVVADPLTATSLTLSSGGNTTVFTTTGTGLNIADSITVGGGGTVTCSNMNASSGIFTTTGDLFVGGEATLAANSNLQGVSLSAAGLYFGRNLEAGQNEFDIIAYNPTSANYLNIYGSSTTAISAASVPIISLANGTAYKNGNEIATVNQIPSVPATYFTGQIVMSIASSPPTATGGTFLLCNGTAYSSTTYPKLFAIIGTVYGTSSGGGFLPNLVSKFPYGANNSSAVPYANSSGTVSGGANTYSLTQVPPHTHSNSISNNTFYSGRSQAGNDSSNNYVVNQNATTTPITNNAGDNIAAGAITIPTVPSYIVVSYFIFAN